MQTHLLHRFFYVDSLLMWLPRDQRNFLKDCWLGKTWNFQMLSWIYSGFPNSKMLRSSVMWYIACSELTLRTYFNTFKWKGWLESTSILLVTFISSFVVSLFKNFLYIRLKSFPYYYVYLLSKTFSGFNTMQARSK